MMKIIKKRFRQLCVIRWRVNVGVVTDQVTYIFTAKYIDLAKPKSGALIKY